MINKPPKYRTIQRGHPILRDALSIFPFNEYQGDVVFDHVDRKNYNFNSSYPPTWESSGVACDGNREHIEWLSFADLPSTLTFVFWYRHTTTPSSYYYFFHLDGASWNRYALMNYGSGTGADLYLWINAVEIVSTTGISSGWTDGEWHFMGIMYDDVSNYGAIIFDDIVAEATTSFTLPTTGNYIAVGARTGIDDRFSGGIWRNFYAWDKILTKEQLQRVRLDTWGCFSGKRVSRDFYIPPTSGVIMPIFSQEGIHANVFR